jgi:hypothetical protein
VFHSTAISSSSFTPYALVYQKLSTIFYGMLSRMIYAWPSPSVATEEQSTPAPSDPFKQSRAKVMASGATSAQKTLQSGSATQFSNARRASLCDLPEELLIEVISYIGNDNGISFERDMRTLANLARSCQRLHRSVVPYLYESYSCHKNQYRLVRTLVTCPDLAAQMKSLQWDLELRALPSGYRVNKVADVLEDRFSDWFAIDAALALRRQQHRDPGQDSDGYFTAALMHCPNIEDIQLVDGPGTRDVRHSRRWLEPLRLRVPHSFERLRTADIRMQSLQVTDIAHLMQLPSLQILKLSEFYEEPLAEWTLPPRVSSVEDLTLHHLNRPERESSNIDGMIASCRALKRFAYNHRDMYMPPSSDTHIFPRLKAALDIHADTLEVLKLDRECWPVGIEAVQYHSSSFTKYTKLESLCSPFSLLAPSNPVETHHQTSLLDVLPGNIHTLQIKHISYQQQGLKNMLALEHMVGYLKSKLPYLTTIYLSSELLAFLRHDDWKRIQAAFAEEGTTLSIHASRWHKNDGWLNPQSPG